MKKLILAMVLLSSINLIAYDALTDGTKGGVNTTYDPIGDPTAPTPNEWAL